MSRFRPAMSSSVVKKLITAITGLALIAFSIQHLLGNLTLFDRSGETFNAYTEKMASFGFLLVIAEIGLAAFFLVHIVNGIRLKINHRSARPSGYKTRIRTKGGPSKSGLSSRTMGISGIIILVFLVAHILHFRLGPGVAEGYVVDLEGKEVRDMHRLVVELFSNPAVVAFYVLSMLVLGAHLRHGFWSAFQSIGALNPRVSPIVNVISVFVALLLAFGFLVLPVYIYFSFSGGAA